MAIKLICVLIWISWAIAQDNLDFSIKELKSGNETQLVEERQGQVDRHATFITFRDSIVNKKGLLTVVNELDQYFKKRGIVPEAYYHIKDNKIAVCTTSLSDMMELKTTLTKEKSVFSIKSGSEVKLGAHITQTEKDEYYRRITRKPKTMKSKEKKGKDEENIKTDL